MKSLKLTLAITLSITFIFPLFCISGECANFSSQEEEELVIPEEVHERAIQSLKALGPKRGAVKIVHSTLKIEVVSKDIVGVVKAVKAESGKIQATLKDLGARISETEIQIDLPGDILFDFDKWDIRPDAEATLKKVAEIIKVYKSPKVVVSGHTDSKGSEDYNQKLSERRAESVKSWFVTKGGIGSGTMETVGYGEAKPVAPNTDPDGSDNPDGRQKNRRVEILIKKGK